MENTFTKLLIKKEIMKAMRKADESYGEYNFLGAVQSIQNDVVYNRELVTSTEFYEICDSILNEMADSAKAQ